MLLADMTVGYKAIRETFTSRVTLDRTNRKILVEYVDGSVLAQLGAKGSVAPELKAMDERIFRNAPMLAARR